jgi:hypothetical protein
VLVSKALPTNSVLDHSLRIVLSTLPQARLIATEKEEKGKRLKKIRTSLRMVFLDQRERLRVGRREEGKEGAK